MSILLQAFTFTRISSLRSVQLFEFRRSVLFSYSNFVASFSSVIRISSLFSVQLFKFRRFVLFSYSNFVAPFCSFIRISSLRSVQLFEFRRFVLFSYSNFVASFCSVIRISYILVPNNSTNCWLHFTEAMFILSETVNYETNLIILKRNRQL